MMARIEESQFKQISAGQKPGNWRPLIRKFIGPCSQVCICFPNAPYSEINSEAFFPQQILAPAVFSVNEYAGFPNLQTFPYGNSYERDPYGFSFRRMTTTILTSGSKMG